jgi:hypothetical protein
MERRTFGGYRRHNLAGDLRAQLLYAAPIGTFSLFRVNFVSLGGTS